MLKWCFAYYLLMPFLTLLYMFSCSLLMGSYSIPEQTSPIKHFFLSEVQPFQISVPVSVSVQL